MNYLIVVPRIVSQLGDWYMFPQGIAYVSSSMQATGFRLAKLNLNHVAGDEYAVLASMIRDNDIEVVLTGGLTGQYGAIRKILEVSKGVRPEIVTVVGGGIITSDPLNGMRALVFADYGLLGEAEISCPRLCRMLENNEDIQSLPAAVFRKGDDFVLTEGKPAVVDIDNIPFPDYQGLEFDRLMESTPNIVGLNEVGTVPIVTSRSCPYRCTFCFHSSGIKYRKRSLDSVFQEIDWLLSRYDIRFLSIQDELFSHKMARVYEFCRRIKPYGVKWWAQFRVSDVTPEALEVLKDANCASLSFGVESADERILESMHKKITVPEVERALDIVYKAGIAIQGNLIFGDIAETVETASNSLRWWKKHAHYGLQLSMIVTYPGTHIYQHALKEGVIADPVEFIKKGCPVVPLSKMSKDEYLWLLGEILSQPRKILPIPREYEIEYIEYEKAKMDFSGSCVTCGKRNRWSAVNFFITESLLCKSCGQRHASPIPDELLAVFSTGISSLYKAYGTVALWGVNPYIYHFIERLGDDIRDKIVCVDNSELRHGLQINGVDIIHAQSDEFRQVTNCVVVMVVQYYSNLRKQIPEMHGSLEKVLSVAELLSYYRSKAGETTERGMPDEHK
uniref:Radical SAM superfamily enzyme YgiQ, UPF0313 family n=1 Tax=Candidatus Kentrum sp. FM TaxID=2126340 RepID=A0A450TJM0_9GAMM|nr:MAG: Radical SAM superfamily enzyme YgiQ, UPF0313 family [Candidatus Kentron sp. FM]VFJ67616.1 MAG: Radical SAM superfamily enzyme YgiQ, UPF0313 family [Candidatus Kentron sp. FM]VFK11389.1 MAG: Radical SAM superfamily enzyme YgiQ, UPF0313 family [Candidatus Kentron sp. FM]